MNSININHSTVNFNLIGDADSAKYHQEDNKVVLTPYGSDMVVEPHSSLIARQINTPIIPEHHSGYIVTNEGLAYSIKAVFYWSHSFTSEWFEYDSVNITLGEQGYLSSPSNSLYYSRVVIYNNTDYRAFITGKSA